MKNQPIPERSGARESAGPVIQDFQQTTMASKGLLVLAPTQSFTLGLKPPFSANRSHCSPSFLLIKYSLHGFPGLFTVISEHICFLLLVFLFLHFLVVGSVR